jgi:uncharacterized protein Yka (UPF0111/DUF47 family)
MAEANTSLIQRIITRVFPKTPDFFALLSEQCVYVGHTAELLVQFMESGTAELGELIKQDEHEADVVKVRNLHILNEAFSTPIDREDLYRAIHDLDEIVNYAKSTVNEMDALGVTPDAYTLEMAKRIQEGVVALAAGFNKLKTTPAAAAADADIARKSERRVEKLYRKALGELFQGEDFRNMFKRREIYRHLSNAADRMANCANTLHDIVVKMC